MNEDRLTVEPVGEDRGVNTVGEMQASGNPSSVGDCCTGRVSSWSTMLPKRLRSDDMAVVMAFRLGTCQRGNEKKVQEKLTSCPSR